MHQLPRLSPHLWVACTCCRAALPLKTVSSLRSMRLLHCTPCRPASPAPLPCSQRLCCHAEGRTSLKRIEEFLLDPDTHANASFDGDNRSIFTKMPNGINVKDAILQFDGHEGRGFKLTIPRFEVKPGEVVAVVGRVGAGKTALLDALLGNMPIKAGHVSVGGRIAVVPQVSS